ncbi:alpha/beta hydrolase [Azospirillum sp. ST 5-10]|uniref:alpha/beta hydrolase n=1 Tax=unclassified Azospirillum TaxID=2630922 RepID=UPI003F4A80A3
MRCAWWAVVLAVLAPLLPVPAFGEAVRRDAGGLTVTGELVEAGGGLGAGTVLLLHGTLAHHGMELIRGLQERLAERGLSSLAVTLSLGLDARRGMYDCGVPHRHRHEDAVAEIDGWVRWLTERGAGPVTLLGHSRGANQVARYLAGDRTAPVARAVLLAPPTGGRPAGADDLLALAGDRADDAWIDVPAFLHCGPGRATAGAVRSYHGADPRHDTPALLAAIGVPVLVLAASDDTVVPDLAERMAALQGTPAVRFQVIGDSDHFFRDFAADDAADAVAAFVAP